MSTGGRDFEALGKQVQLALRAYERSGGASQLHRQLEKATRGLEAAGVFEQAGKQNQTAVEALKRSGAFEQIERQAQQVRRALAGIDGFQVAYAAAGARLETLQTADDFQAMAEEVGRPPAGETESGEQPESPLTPNARATQAAVYELLVACVTLLNDIAAKPLPTSLLNSLHVLIACWWLYVLTECKPPGGPA
jgi:hypothetical protein